MEMPKDWIRKDDFRQWVLLHLITKFDLIKKGVVGPRREGDGEIDVVLTINGHEVDFLVAADSLEAQHERMVSDAADRVVHEKIHEVLMPFEDTLHDVARIIEDRCGLRRNEDGDLINVD